MKNYLFISIFCVISSIHAGAEIPATFGKTHFIHGVSPEYYKKVTQKNTDNALSDGSIRQVFFAPDDNIQKKLLQLIKQEKESIKVAVYSFTEGEIAKALLDAHKRGVHVQVVVDPTCLHDRYNKVVLLAQGKPHVYVYNRNKNKSILSSLMHNKFLLFGKNMHDKALLWTGSCNLTKSAHQRNQENALLLDDVQVIRKYTRQFEVLKKRSNRLIHKTGNQQNQQFFAQQKTRRQKSIQS